MTGTVAVRLGAVCLAVALATDVAAAPARRPVRKGTSSAAAKVSASQLFLRLDSIDRRLDDIQKTGGTGKAAPAVVMPGPGEGVASKEMTQAFYNFGVYSREASGSRIAARAIKLVTFVGGASLALAGWESARDKTAPKTINNAYHEYPAFSFGVTTVLLGQLVGMIMDFRADSADGQAARALMKPLESSSDSASHTVPATLTPGSTAP